MPLTFSHVFRPTPLVVDAFNDARKTGENKNRIREKVLSNLIRKVKQSPSTLSYSEYKIVKECLKSIEQILYDQNSQKLDEKLGLVKEAQRCAKQKMTAEAREEFNRENLKKAFMIVEKVLPYLEARQKEYKIKVADIFVSLPDGAYKETARFLIEQRNPSPFAEDSEFTRTFFPASSPDYDRFAWTSIQLPLDVLRAIELDLSDLRPLLAKKDKFLQNKSGCMSSLNDEQRLLVNYAKYYQDKLPVDTFNLTTEAATEGEEAPPDYYDAILSGNR